MTAESAFNRVTPETRPSGAHEPMALSREPGVASTAFDDPELTRALIACYRLAAWRGRQLRLAAERDNAERMADTSWDNSS